MSARAHAGGVVSQYAGSAQLRAIARIGDLMLPGTEELPRFSETRCIADIDRVLAYVPPGDLQDLNTLLLILAYLPKFVLRWFLWLLERSTEWGWLPGILRVIRLGLRGIILGLYYGHPSVHQRIGFAIRVEPLA